MLASTCISIFNMIQINHGKIIDTTLTMTLTIIFLQQFFILSLCDNENIDTPNTLRTLLSQSADVSTMQQSLRHDFINDIINATAADDLEKYLQYGTLFLDSHSEFAESHPGQAPALMISIQYSNWISFNFLINHGANINYWSPVSTLTPLKFAMVSSQKKFVEALVHHEKIDLNEQKNQNRETPLILAIRLNKFDEASIILQNERVDVSLKDFNNQNALHHACVQNWKDGVNEIIFHESSDESLFETDSKMMTPLLLASKFSTFEMMDALLQHKKIAQTINLANIDEVTPLIQAVMEGGARKDPETRFKAEILIEAGAEVDTRDNRGLTALFYAFSTGKIVTAQVLIANGANINLADEFGRTYLHLASIYDWLNAADMMIKQGYICIDVQDSYGRTPLMLASLHDNPQITGRFR